MLARVRKRSRRLQEIDVVLNYPRRKQNVFELFFSVAGILISLILSSSQELITELSTKFREGQRREKQRGEKDIGYHGRSGCAWTCGRRVFTVSVLCFFFTVVSNGVDTIRFPCSFKVRVMRRAFPQSKFFFFDGFKCCRHNTIPVQCSECQSGEKFKTSADKRQETP